MREFAKQLLALLVLSLFQPSLLAATANQEALLIEASGRTIELKQQLWFYEDTEHRPAREVLSEPGFADLFAPLQKKAPNFGFTSSAWWARVPLLNNSSANIPLVVSEGYAVVDSIEFFLLDSAEKVQSHLAVGDRGKPTLERQMHRLPHFRFELPPGQHWLYVRIQTEGSASFNLKVEGERTFLEGTTREYVFIVSQLAILLAMAAYNLFIWMQLRKLTYLIYIGFILTMVCQPLAYSGMAVHVFGQYSWFMNHGYLTIANTSSVFACLFPILFLSLPQRHPWLARFCYLGIGLAAITYLGLASSYNTGAKLSVLTATFASIVTLTCGVVCSLKRFRPAYFFTLAWLVMIVANFLRMAMVSGAIPQAFLIEWGVLIGSVIEVILLSLALADKVRLNEKQSFERIETLNRELQREHDTVVQLNNNLERMVEEQTREIKSILKNIQIGIAVIGKQDLRLTENYSESIKTIYQTQRVAGIPALDFLLSQTNVSSEQRSQVQSLLECSLGEGAFNFDINAHILPRECQFGQGNQLKILQLDWNPVIDKDETIEKILVSVKDVTELKKLESDAAEKSKELLYIGEILDVTPKQFGIFIQSTQKFLADNLRLIKSNFKFDREIVKILFINLHTIKGAARALGLKQLTPLIHQAEQYLAGVMQSGSGWNREQVLQDTRRIQDLIDTYQVLNQSKLGRSSGDSFQLAGDFIERIHGLLSQILESPQVPYKPNARALKMALEDLTYTRAETVFREVLSNAEMLARDLSKECPQIVIEDHGIMLSSEGQELVRNTFVHIVRNSMDHGMENSQERLRQGKPAEGRIEVELVESTDGLEISYKDDGRGLNLRAIRRRAIERGLLKESQTVSVDELAYFIFEAGFSTSETVNDISGRGVGMYAVKDYVEAKGGQVLLILDQKPKTIDPEYVPFHFVVKLGAKLHVARAA